MEKEKQVKQFEVSLIDDLLSSLKQVSDGKIGKLALYFWYFSHDHTDNALGQFIHKLASYAFYMGLEQSEIFFTLFPNIKETIHDKVNTINSESFKSFFDSWESEICFAPWEEMFSNELIDNKA